MQLASQLVLTGTRLMPDRHEGGSRLRSLAILCLSNGGTRRQARNEEGKGTSVWPKVTLLKPFAETCRRINAGVLLKDAVPKTKWIYIFLPMQMSQSLSNSANQLMSALSGRVAQALPMHRVWHATEKMKWQGHSCLLEKSNCSTYLQAANIQS